MSDVDPSAVTAAEPSAGGSGPRAAETIGKYRLDRLIGAGGMGVVWAAFDTDLQRAVALKLLHAETANTTLQSRLLREAVAMARLRHPNTVTVYDVGTVNGRDYIAMELVDGGTLDAWLETRPPRAQILDALLAAGRGLAAAHTAGLVHRDFKPHNVLRSADGHVYVTDFGLARGQIEDGPELVPVAHAAELQVAATASRRRDPVLDTPLTQTGVLIGTPAYMAPEQFAGGVPDPSADQFAFCVTAWQALTGERPFRGTSIPELEASIREGTRHLAVDLPAPLRAVLERGLDADPAKRWPDMPALLAALTEATTKAPRRGNGRRWVIAAIAGTLLVAGGTITMFALRDNSDERGCVPAEKAFASAWGPEQKEQLRATRRETPFGAMVLLDETRRRWIRTYERACKAPQTEDNQERIRCLLTARDDIGRAVMRLASGESDAEMAELASLTAAVVMCDPSHLKDELDMLRGPSELPGPPAPPDLPRPPAPPAP